MTAVERQSMPPVPQYERYRGVDMGLVTRMEAVRSTFPHDTRFVIAQEIAHTIASMEEHDKYSQQWAALSRLADSFAQSGIIDLRQEETGRRRITLDDTGADLLVAFAWEYRGAGYGTIHLGELARNVLKSVGENERLAAPLREYLERQSEKKEIKKKAVEEQSDTSLPADLDTFRKIMLPTFKRPTAREAAKKIGHFLVEIGRGLPEWEKANNKLLEFTRAMQRVGYIHLDTDESSGRRTLVFNESSELEILFVLLWNRVIDHPHRHKAVYAYVDNSIVALENNPISAILQERKQQNNTRAHHAAKDK